MAKVVTKKIVKAKKSAAKAVKKPLKKVGKVKKAKKATSSAKAPVAKISKSERRRQYKRVQLITAPKPVVHQAVVEYVPIDTEKATALGLSLAKQLKMDKAKADEERARSEMHKYARRPTTRAQGKQTVKFPAADLKEFRRRLMEARNMAERGVDAMKATGFNETEDHEADGGDGTAQTLRLQALGQMGNINRTIQQIDEALHRINEGTYGVCKVCGQLIRKPRLLNQPFVLTCMECQDEMEREQR